VKGCRAVANVEDLGLLPVTHHALASRRGIDKVERLDPRLEKVRARASRQINGMNHIKKNKNFASRTHIVRIFLECQPHRDVVLVRQGLKRCTERSDRPVERTRQGHHRTG